MSDKWKHGQKTKIANYVKISNSYLGSILRRRRRAPAKLAVQLEKASEIILGEKIPRTDWIYSLETENPYFYGQNTP